MKKYANIIGAVLVLVLGAFVFGIHVGESRIPEVEKVKALFNKDGDMLTAQVGQEVDQFSFTPYWRVWNTLDRKFIPFGTTTEEVALEDKVYRSIEGLVASYNDPYTVFMRPQVAEEFKMATRGSLEGIGAVIGDREGALIVVSPLEGSPAEKAGLLAGDNILKVDGTETAGMTVEHSVTLIRGQGGTVVTLTIQRNSEEPMDVSITRETIEIPSTAHVVIAREVPKKAPEQERPPKEERPSEEQSQTPPFEDEVPEEAVPEETEVRDFYFLRLFSFSQSSINAFERELNDFVESGSDSLVIDLRGNPGGYIESAVQIASWFLKKDDVVVREYNGPDKREVLHLAKDKILFQEALPNIAVLVDGSSASASEILAGALQEHGVATVIGTNTFGKGSVQELVSITDELSLKVTVARWYTPNGVSISQGGLTPDILIDPTNATSGDPWVEEAITFLSTT